MDRLPAKFVHAVVAFVYGPLAENPARVGRLLRFELEGFYGARSGVHRVIYMVDETQRVVSVHAVAHRGAAYRRGA